MLNHRPITVPEPARRDEESRRQDTYRHTEEGRREGRRSLFWPIMLIGAGSIWLLSNLGLIDVQNLGLLFRLWPLALIAFGIKIVFSYYKREEGGHGEN